MPGDVPNNCVNLLIFKEDYYTYNDKTTWRFMLNSNEDDVKRRVIFGFLDDMTINIVRCNEAGLVKVYGINF